MVRLRRLHDGTYPGAERGDATDTALAQLEKLITELVPEWIRQGEMLSGGDAITFSAATSQTLEHSLGRAYKGFAVVSDTGGTANALRAVEPSDENEKRKRIELVSANACTVKVWIW